MASIDLEKLKIENAIFDYGLTNQDVENIKNISEELKKYNPNDSIQALYKAKKTIWVISVSHSFYEGLIVEVANTEGSLLETTKAQYSMNNKVFFKFKPTVEQYKRIETLRDVYKELRKSVYHSEDQDVVASYDEAVELIKDKFFKLSIENNSFNEKEEVETILKCLCELFDQDYNSIMERLKEEIKDIEMNKIVMVIENDNKRLYAYTKNNLSGNPKLLTKFNLCFGIVNTDNDHYNYIDVGRYFWSNGSDKIFLFNDLTLRDIEENTLRRINNENRELFVVNKTQYNMYKKKLFLKELKEKREESLKEKYKTAVEKKLSGHDKKEFTYNDLTFSDKGIEFEGLVLKVNSVDGKRNFTREFIKSIDLNERTDFNNIFQQLCGTIALDKRKIVATLGKVKVKRELKGVFYYINDKRINKADMLDVLMRAICFDKQENYDDFLADISKISLDYHTVLNNGLVIVFRKQDRYHDEYLMRLQMKRKSNAFYLVHKDKEFKLKHSRELLNITTLRERYIPYFSDVWNKLNRCLPDVDDETKIEILKEGLKEHKKAEARAEKLLKNTMKILKVKRGELIHESSKTEGYVIPGKLRTYFLTDNLKVFDYKTKKYFCIVDTTHSKRVKKDKLVNRMLALANDDRLIKDIYTLK